MHRPSKSCPHSRWVLWLWLLFACPFVAAQTWPSKPITIVSPYPAGGITDQLSRIVAGELSKRLGQSVLVENKLGAGGAIAMQAVARAPNDGYTLVMGGSAVSTILPALNPRIGYDPILDFAPIGYVAALPIMRVVSAAIPAANLKEFIQYAKDHSGKLNCGHHGPGTGTHLACLEFAKMTQTDITDVAYKGAPQVNTDLVSDRVQLYFGTLPTELALVRSGQLRTFGVASATRAPAAPDIPTLTEQGVSGLNLDSWNALYAPAGTPQPVIERLSSALIDALSVPSVRERIEATGSVLHPGSAQALGALTKQEFENYKKLASDNNIRLD